MTGLKSPQLKKEASITQWLADLRTQAYDRYEETGFPTRKWEAWKYIDLAAVTSATIAGQAPKALADVILSDIATYLVKPEAARIVFVNGVFSKPLSFSGKLPRPITLVHIEGAFRSHPDDLHEHLGSLADTKNAFVDINTFSFRDGVYLYIPEHTHVEDAIEFLFIETEEGSTPLVTHPRVLVSLGKGAKAHIVSTHVSRGKGVSAMNQVAEIFLEDSAELEYVNVHRGGSEATQFFSGFASLGAKSIFKFFSFIESEGVTRSEMNSIFKGAGAEAQMQGLSLLSGKAQSFMHPSAGHDAGHGTSRQCFKSILSGQTQSEFNSMVRVSPEGVKTDSQQLSRTLLLSEDAVAHARPQLQIDIDDVVCAHGATVGQLQAQELFYLRTRGLSEKTARYLLTYGFAEEMLGAVELPALHKMLKERMEAKLSKMVAS